MDAVGELKIGWAAGYNGAPIGFVSSDVLCMHVGSVATFVKDNGSFCDAHKSVGEGMGCLTAHPSGLFAYSDHSLPPKVFMVVYPQCDVRYTCEGEAELEYRDLAFMSDGRRLVTLAGLPDFTLAVWDCESGSKLCKANCQSWPGVCKVSSNPANWHQLVITGPDCLVVWEVEKFRDQYVLTSSDVGPPDVTSPPNVQTVKSQPQITIRDLPGEEPFYPFGLSHVLSDFGHYSDLETCQPVTINNHCWGANSNVYCSCDGGQVLKLDTESMILVLLVNPQVNNEGEGNKGDDVIRPGDGSANCIAVNKTSVLIGGKDGIVRCISLASGGSAENVCQCSGEFDSLWFSPNYGKLFAGTSKGSLYCLPASQQKKTPVTVFSHGRDQFVGLDILLSGDEYCVTSCENGLVQLWHLDVPSCIGVCDIKAACVSLSASPSSHCTAIGTTDGHVYFLDFNNPENPRVVHCLYLHHGPVTHLRFDQSGSFLVTASDDGNVFVCSALPSQNFQVIGYTRVSGPVQCLTVCVQGTGSSLKGFIAAVVNDSGELLPDARKVTTFTLDTDWLKPGSTCDLFEDSTCLLKDGVIGLRLFDIDMSPQSVASVFVSDSTDVILFALVENSKQLFQLKVPSVVDEDVTVLNVESQYPAHLLPGGTMALSLHGKWLLTCGHDGCITARLTASLDRGVTIQGHNFNEGGVKAVCFTGDAQKVVSVGNDGTLACWKWSFSSQGRQKSGKAVDAFKKHQAALRRIVAEEDEKLKNLPAVDVEDKDSSGTWLDGMVTKAHHAEDEKYTEMKAKIRQEIDNLRKAVMKLIDDNSEVPDIEKLERQDFNLDTEEQQLLTAESDEQVKQVREEIELANIKKLYLKEKIKQECWDSMEVQGKTIKGFDTTIEVRNYPVRRRNAEEIKELQAVKLGRKIELLELEAQAEICQTARLVTPGLEEEDDDGLQVTKEDEECDGLSHYGSRGPEFGGESDLLYSQFELVTPERQMKQIVLLKECIRQIKLNFNKEFHELLKQKESELSRTQEKNIRIRKILTNLQLSEKMYDPTSSADEHPEWDLEVDDDEVTAEKYVSEEERKRLDEEAKLAEERRLAELGDNARERALDMMMGGRLEVKTEDDIFKDLPKPEFVMTKLSDTFTEDEQKQAKEYEKKQAMLLEEREKHRLALEAELKKLQSSIIEACAAFDGKVLKLHRLRIHTETVVYEEELKILRLLWSLLIQEELVVKEGVLQQRLEEGKSKKVQSASQLVEYKKQLENFREMYENLVQEDKAMDRAFKKDFSDCEPNVEILYKLFRRRPRGQQRKSAAESDPATSFSVVSAPSARGSGGFADALKELDSQAHMPSADGIDHNVWERLVAARRAKIQSEQQVKSAALELAEMTAFVQRRTLEDSEIQQTIEDAFREINKLREERTRMEHNPEVQLLLKQGQVEVDPGNFIPDFRDSVLVHRSVIEDLNATIKTLGDAKIASMNESKDFRKNIASLEWEHEKLNMEMENLREKAREIQLLKVTKELQMALIDDNRARNQQKEISTLEETLAMTKEAHDRRRRDHKRRVAKLKRQIHEKADGNREMDADLEELAVSVAERHNVEDAQAQYPSDDTAEKRMRDIRARRRLVDLAKTQAQEIAVLRAEVERLRMRTFPALVKMERH